MARASARRVARLFRRVNRPIPAASRSSRRHFGHSCLRWRSTTLSPGRRPPVACPDTGMVPSTSKPRGDSIVRQSSHPSNPVSGRALRGGDRVASRVRVAASACLVASGLFMAGAGGAIALADPGNGYGSSDDRTGDDSMGGVIRRALGMDRRQRPRHRSQGSSRGTAGERPTGAGSGREGTAEDDTIRRRKPRKTQPRRRRPARKLRAPNRPTRRARPRRVPSNSGGGGGGAIVATAALQAADGARHATARRTDSRASPGRLAGRLCSTPGGAVAAAGPSGPRYPSPCR